MHKSYPIHNNTRFVALASHVSRDLNKTSIDVKGMDGMKGCVSENYMFPWNGENCVNGSVATEQFLLHQSFCDSYFDEEITFKFAICLTVMFTFFEYCDYAKLLIIYKWFNPIIFFVHNSRYCELRWGVGDFYYHRSLI